METTLQDRMLECIKASGLKNEEIAVACGVSAPTSFNWASGKTKNIKAKPLLKAAKLFGVTPEWLSTGAQPKYAPDGLLPTVQTPASRYAVAPQHDKMTTELIDLFNQLNKASKHEYLGQLRGFVLGRSAPAKDLPAEHKAPVFDRLCQRTGSKELTMPSPFKTMGGAEFKLHMKLLMDGLSDDDEVYFGAGDLSFYRLKDRGPVGGPRLVQIEFNEVYKVLADPDTP